MKQSLLPILLILLFSACKNSSNEPFPDSEWDLSISAISTDRPNDQFQALSSYNLKYGIQIITGTGGADDPYNCLLEISNQGTENWKGIIRIELSDNSDSGRFFLPGFMYGTNQGDVPFNKGLTKQFPRLRKGALEAPYAPYWHARSDQLTHPVAMLYSNEMLYGISAEPYSTDRHSEVTYNGFYCALNEKSTIGFTEGYLEAPGLYVSPWEFKHYTGKEKSVIAIDRGQKRTINFELYAFPAQGEFELGRVLKHVYGVYHESPGNSASAEQAIQDITRAISEDAYSSQNKTYALINKLPVKGPSNKMDGGGARYALNNQDGDSYRPYLEGLIAWTNGSVITGPLLKASYALNQPKLRDQALEVIQDIVLNSTNPRSGLPFCTKVDGQWTNKGWWTEWVESEGVSADHSSYIIGQALYYILKAYQFESEIYGVEHQVWLDFVEQNLNLMASSQRSDGAFPRFWAEKDLRGSEYDAFAGCWCATAMALHTKVTGLNTYARNTRNAERYYFRHVKKMECIKTPLDVGDAPDSEGILAYIRLSKILHELSGDSIYLEHLISGLDYSFSFKFCYNVPITEPPLNHLNWSSSGGDITSVCNAVIHCMSNTILEEIMYCHQLTQDPYYLSRYEDTFLWGLQAYNREANEFFFGKKGWSTEYFCQSNRYVLDIRLEDNSRSSIWFAYHPWATASILEGLLVEVTDD